MFAACWAYLGLILMLFFNDVQNHPKQIYSEKGTTLISQSVGKW